MDAPASDMSCPATPFDLIEHVDGGGEDAIMATMSTNAGSNQR
jgi:hypothetical protein